MSFDHLADDVVAVLTAIREIQADGGVSPDIAAAMNPVLAEIVEDEDRLAPMIGVIGGITAHALAVQFGDWQAAMNVVRATVERGLPDIESGV